MTFRRNVLANYAAQVYVTFIGLLVTPLYIKGLGAEAYGLVGFYTVLQAWFSMLDFGLTPTVSRESARYRAGVLSCYDYVLLIKYISRLFFVVSLIGGVVFLSFSDLISTNWLNIRELPHGEVLFAVQVMALSAAMRWMGGVYRGVITGCEQLVWMSMLNAGISTLRFLGVFASLEWFGYRPHVFFLHQLIVATFELILLNRKANSLMPSANASEGEKIKDFRSAIAPLMGFSVMVALTSSLWVLITQVDKFILSGILPLEEYGYFSLAVTVAGAVNILSGPLSSAVLPRMASLHASGDVQGVLNLYGRATEIVVAVPGCIAISLAAMPDSFLMAWTGLSAVVENSSRTMMLYAIGNGFLAISAFPYYLQYAKGNLRFHMIGILLMGGVSVPLLVIAARALGQVGAGAVWILVNALYLFLWVGYVHRQISPGIHFSWLINNVVKVALLPAVIGLILHLLPQWADTRMEHLVRATFGSCLILISSVFSSRYLRGQLLCVIKKSGFNFFK